MTSLQDELVKVGLATVEEAKSVDRQHLKTLVRENERAWWEKREARMAELSDASDMAEFRLAAEMLLIFDATATKEVVKAAEKFKHRSEDHYTGKKLMWVVLQVQELLPNVSEEERARFLRNAFSFRVNSIELPKNSKKHAV